MKRGFIYLLLCIILASCEYHETGKKVVVDKQCFHRTIRSDKFVVVFMYLDTKEKHPIQVSEETYAKYNIGDTLSYGYYKLRERCEQ